MHSEERTRLEDSVMTMNKSMKQKEKISTKDNEQSIKMGQQHVNLHRCYEGQKEKWG